LGPLPHPQKKWGGPNTPPIAPQIDTLRVWHTTDCQKEFPALVLSAADDPPKTCYTLKYHIKKIE
jgi:hypothetical protein